MTYPIKPACRNCHAVENVAACKRCYTAFYCVKKKCQSLDWERHKIFCHSAEPKEMAIARRERCLSLIANSEIEVILKQLMYTKLMAEAGCIVLREDMEPTFLTYKSLCLKTKEKQKLHLDPITLAELKSEVEYKTEIPAATILFIGEHLTRVYVVSASYAVTVRKNKVMTLKDSVEQMPEKVRAEILTLYWAMTQASLEIEEEEEKEEEMEADVIIKIVKP